MAIEMRGFREIGAAQPYTLQVLEREGRKWWGAGRYAIRNLADGKKVMRDMAAEGYGAVIHDGYCLIDRANISRADALRYGTATVNRLQPCPGPGFSGLAKLEPWQMTRQVFVESQVPGTPYDLIPFSSLEPLLKKHRASTVRAFNKGRPVPASVLMQYADLAAKAGLQVRQWVQPQLFGPGGRDMGQVRKCVRFKRGPTGQKRCARYTPLADAGLGQLEAALSSKERARIRKFQDNFINKALRRGIPLDMQVSLDMPGVTLKDLQQYIYPRYENVMRRVLRDELSDELRGFSGVGLASDLGDLGLSVGDLGQLRAGQCGRVTVQYCNTPRGVRFVGRDPMQC